MNPIFELGNSCIKFSFFTILNKNKVKLVITFFNKIKLSLFFHNKYYISFESMSSKTPDKKKYINQIEVYETFKPKYTEYKKIDNLETDIKTIAWYLPQFHTFKENDEWCGKGFTEWTNVKKAKPLYDGHYQPRIPHSDLGYYDLSDVNVMKKQVEIAKNYGLYGFCFYHYDFSGKRLMEKPVDNFLKEKSINFNFCLSYANENWTRTWDGNVHDILIKQNHSTKDDIRFIKSLQKYFDDDRYIKIDGKPMLLVYRPLLFPDIKATTDRWREYQLKKTNKDLFLVFTRSIAKPEEHSSLYGFDIYVDFNIHNAIFSKSVGTGCENSRSYKTLYEDTINSYGDIAFKELFLLWDNSPRKKKDYLIMENFNFDYYRKWLQYNIKYTRKNFETDKRFMFINAWNEWGEGTYLEPDEANGYTMLDILADELSIKKGQNT